MKKNALFGVLVTIVSLALLFFSPIINFGIAYLAGWILQLFIGEAVAGGLNALFNTERFTADRLPLFCGALALIGRALESHNLDTGLAGEAAEPDDTDGPS